MRKLNLAVAFALGLSIPFGAVADADVTIRVMQMNEKATAAVMKMIELPDAVGEESVARDNVAKANKNREMALEHMVEGRDHAQNQEHENEHKNEHENEREEHENEREDHIPDNNRDNEHGQGRR